MRRRRSFVTAITAAAVSSLLLGNVAFAASTSAEDYDYTVYADHVEITKYIGEDAEVIIPEEIEGLPVTVIADGAFYEATVVTDVYFPDSVESIMSTSFNDKTLKTVYGSTGSIAVTLADFFGIEFVEGTIEVEVDEAEAKAAEEKAKAEAEAKAAEEKAKAEAEAKAAEEKAKAEAEAKAAEEKAKAEAEAKAAEEKAKAEAEAKAAEEKAKAEAEAKAAEEKAKAEAEAKAAEEKAKAEAEAKAAEEAEAAETGADAETESEAVEAEEEDVVDMVVNTEEPRYIMEESAERVLTEEDVADLEQQIISYSKLEILARKGMIFQSEEMAGYFENQSWYFGFIEQENFPVSMLSDQEVQNLMLLEDLENTAGDEKYVFDQEDYSYDLVYEYVDEKYHAKEAAAENPEAEEDPEALVESGAIMEEETNLEDDEDYFVMTRDDTAYAEEEAKAAEEKAKAEAEAKAAEEKAKAEAEAKAAEEKAKAEAEAKAAEEKAKAEAKKENELFEITTSEEQTFQQTTQTQQTQTVSEYIFKDSNSRYLSKSEVQALSQQAICYAKNEVYARHGRKFMSVELQQYFGSKSWYQGTVEPANFSEGVFNDYELKNIALLVECEFAISSTGYLLDQAGYDITRVKTS